MGPTVSEIRPGDDRQTALALATSIAAQLTAAILLRGTASMALSGGRTPAPLFDALRDCPLAWDKLVIVQVDERWVATDHPDSNNHLIREHLLQGAAAAARFVPMKNEATDPYQGQPDCEKSMQGVPRPFDIMLLGIGDDGHTASLFPGAAELADGLSTQAMTLAVTPPAAPHPRMTLSLRGLLDSRRIVLQISGAAKEAVYRLALGAGAVADMPIRAILRQSQVPVEVWIAD